MFQPLTERQKECLRLTRWMTDKQIAARLGLSEATVKKHVLEACRRLGVNRRKAALALVEAGEPALAAPDTTVPPPATDAPPSEADHGPVRGYRPPPRDPLARIVLIGAATAIGALLLGLATEIVAHQHRGVRAIDQAIQPTEPQSAGLA